MVIFKSNSKSLLCVTPKIMWFLKSPFDQNSIVINHKANDDFKSHFIF
jgi:hypothetical protein